MDHIYFHFINYISYRLADKIPVLIEQLKKEGKSDAEIKEILANKKIHSVEKYGNKSKIGLLFENQNEQIMKN